MPLYPIEGASSKDAARPNIRREEMPPCRL